MSGDTKSLLQQNPPPPNLTLFYQLDVQLHLVINTLLHIGLITQCMQETIILINVKTNKRFTFIFNNAKLLKVFYFWFFHYILSVIHLLKPSGLHHWLWNKGLRFDTRPGRGKKCGPLMLPAYLWYESKISTIVRLFGQKCDQNKWKNKINEWWKILNVFF